MVDNANTSLPPLQIREVEPVDLSNGWFTLSFDDDGSYGLKSGDSKSCARWVDALEERIEWAKNHKPSKSGGRSGGGSDDDEEDGGGRRKTTSRRGRQRGDSEGEDDDEDARRSGKRSAVASAPGRGGIAIQKIVRQ